MLNLITSELTVMTCRSRIYMLKVNYRNTRIRCEIGSRLTIKIPPERILSGIFIVNFEYISHLVLVFLLLTFNI